MTNDPVDNIVVDKLLDAMLLTTEEAAALLRMSVRRLKAEARQRRIAVCRVRGGKTPLFPIQTIKDYIEAHTVKAEER